MVVVAASQSMPADASAGCGRRDCNLKNESLGRGFSLLASCCCPWEETEDKPLEGRRRFAAAGGGLCTSYLGWTVLPPPVCFRYRSSSRNWRWRVSLTI